VPPPDNVCDATLARKINGDFHLGPYPKASGDS